MVLSIQSSSAYLGTPEAKQARASSVLESKVTEVCRVPMSIVYSVEDRRNINRTIQRCYENGVIDETDLEKIEEYTGGTRALSKSLEIQVALFAPDNKLIERAAKRRSDLSNNFTIYNLMLLCASRISPSNKPKGDIIYFELKDVIQIKNLLGEVKKMLKSKINERHWPTSKILFGAVLIYLTSSKNETNIIPDKMDIDEFISRCELVYRNKFRINLNEDKNKDYIRLQSLAAAIYFLHKFGYIQEYQLSELEKELLNLYCDKVTPDQLNATYERFSDYYNNEGLLELKLEKMLSEWSLLKEGYYQFLKDNDLGESFPRLAPSSRLFFKSNAFLGVLFKLLNDKTERAKLIENKYFKKILSEWLDVYLDFASLENIFKARSNPEALIGNTITISELQRLPLENLQSIRIESIEDAYYEALIKVISNISSQIEVNEDIQKKIDRIANLANIDLKKAGKLDHDADVNNFVGQIGAFFRIQKDLKAYADWLDLHSLMVRPNSKIEKEACALLKRDGSNHLAHLEELENFNHACNLYRIMKALVVSRSAEHRQKAKENTEFDNPYIFMKSQYRFIDIEEMLNNSIIPLAEGPDAEKLLFGAFLIYLESEKGNLSKVLNKPEKDFILEYFLNLCEGIYLEEYEDLDNLSYIKMQAISAAIYFLHESGRLENLSPLEKFLKEMVLSNGYKELCENLSRYKMLYPYFKNREKNSLSKKNF